MHSVHTQNTWSYYKVDVTSTNTNTLKAQYNFITMLKYAIKIIGQQMDQPTQSKLLYTDNKRQPYAP